MSNVIQFIDEGGQHTRDEHCKACFGNYYDYYCQCGGKFHVEITSEDCLEDYSDCWDVCDYRCDKCGSETLGTEKDDD